MILHADGLFDGERLRRCSQRARLLWPYFFLLANGYARLELDWNRIAARFWSFPEPPTPAEVEAFFSDYTSHHLLFVYTDKSKKWGQWDTRRGNLPDYRNAADKRSPEPPAPEYEKWLQEYHGENWREYDCREAALRSRRRETQTSFSGDSRVNRATIASDTREDHPVGVGDGTGTGAGEELHLASELVGLPNPASRKKTNRAPSESGLRLAQVLRKCILKNNPEAKVTEVQVAKWAVDANRMIRIDGRTEEQIETLIEWCQNDNFWFANILSMGKLREQFDQLTLRSRKQPSQVRPDASDSEDYRPAAPRWTGLTDPKKGDLAK